MRRASCASAKLSVSRGCGGQSPLEATFKELQKQIPTKILRIWDANDEDRNVTVRKIELVQVNKFVKSMSSTYSLTSHC
jgi:hypothetical protein